MRRVRARALPDQPLDGRRVARFCRLDELRVERVSGGGEEGDSAISFGTISLSVAAVDDAPLIGGTASDTLTETDKAQQASGQLTIADADAGESAFQTQTGTAGIYGSFSVGAAGAWTYDLEASKADALTEGQLVTETFKVLSADGTATTVKMTITGTNDAPEVSGTVGFTMDQDGTIKITEAQLLALSNDVEVLSRPSLRS